METLQINSAMVSIQKQVSATFWARFEKHHHLHYDLSGPKEDRNCVFPIDRAEELVKDGVIGSLADTYYSFMGFIQEPEILAKETAPEVARLLKADGVDAVVLTAT